MRMMLVIALALALAVSVVYADGRRSGRNHRGNDGYSRASSPQQSREYRAPNNTSRPVRPSAGRASSLPLRTHERAAMAGRQDACRTFPGSGVPRVVFDPEKFRAEKGSDSYRQSWLDERDRMRHKAK